MSTADNEAMAHTLLRIHKLHEEATPAPWSPCAGMLLGPGNEVVCMAERNHDEPREDRINWHTSTGTDANEELTTELRNAAPWLLVLAGEALAARATR